MRHNLYKRFILGANGLLWEIKMGKNVDEKRVDVWVSVFTDHRSLIEMLWEDGTEVPDLLHTEVSHSAGWIKLWSHSCQFLHEPEESWWSLFVELFHPNFHCPSQSLMKVALHCGSPPRLLKITQIFHLRKPADHRPLLDLICPYVLLWKTFAWTVQSFSLDAVYKSKHHSVQPPLPEIRASLRWYRRLRRSRGGCEMFLMNYAVCIGYSYNIDESSPQITIVNACSPPSCHTKLTTWWNKHSLLSRWDTCNCFHCPPQLHWSAFELHR